MNALQAIEQRRLLRMEDNEEASFVLKNEGKTSSSRTKATSVKKSRHGKEYGGGKDLEKNSLIPVETDLDRKRERHLYNVEQRIHCAEQSKYSAQYLHTCDRSSY